MADHAVSSESTKIEPPDQPVDSCSVKREGHICDGNDVLPAIRQWLNDSKICFREIEHTPTHTSEESAKARGESLHTGAKALVLKIDSDFRLLVLPADRRLDSNAVKRHFHAKKVRFATTEELQQLTNLSPGAVPPFGSPILPLELFADESIGDHEDKVAFNAGSLTHSVVMRASDWIAAARPKQFRFSK